MDTIADRAALSADEEEVLRRVATDLAADVHEVADEVTRGVLARHPSLAPANDHAAAVALQRSTVANVGAVLTTLAFGIRPDAVNPPTGALDLISLVARRGDDLPVLLRAYRLGAAEAWVALVGPLTRQATDTTSLARLLAVSHEHIETYADHLAQVITERWSALAQDSARSRQRRSNALRRLLEGDSFSPAALDHPLDTTHVAVAMAATSGPALAAAVEAIERCLPGVATITHEETSDALCVTWLAGVAELAQAESAVRAVASTVPATFAVSALATGRDGFETVYREAVDTLNAMRGLRAEPGVLTYRESALTATLLADPARATRLAEVVLGPLGAASPEAARLRATLRAYFDADCRMGPAATALGIHEKTVAYRLRRVAAMTGATAASRRADLQAALAVRTD